MADRLMRQHVVGAADETGRLHGLTRRYGGGGLAVNDRFLNALKNGQMMSNLALSRGLGEE